VFTQIIPAERSTTLKKNGKTKLIISISQDNFDTVIILNGPSFITKNISKSDLVVKPNNYYMIVNKGSTGIEITYSEDVSNHEIVYDPYKYENSKKVNYKPEEMIKIFDVPEGYVETLPKWYSFKFTYPTYNIIFVRPELGISIQIHDLRNEYWEILEGEPIIINGNDVHYFVKSGSKFEIPINTLHSVINPNQDKFVILKERWDGKFDEEDITREFNPNNYK
jgi:mannose-6-phosphate isomerase-like protein (cupin superfamily)